MIIIEEIELKNHLLKLEEELLKPEIRSHPDRLNQLLADDFFEFGSSGKVWHKEGNYINGLSNREMILSEFEIHPISEAAVLATYRIHDKTRSQKTLRSSIWRNNNGKWEMIFHQGTLTDEIV